jgi:hypothetical protein
MKEFLFMSLSRYTLLLLPDYEIMPVIPDLNIAGSPACCNQGFDQSIFLPGI